MVDSTASIGTGLGFRPTEVSSLPASGILGGESLSLGDLLKGKDVPSPPIDTLAKTIVITEGIPPIPTKLISRIRSWQYIDFADILTCTLSGPEDASALTTPISNQIIMVQSMEEVRKKRKQVIDLASWLQGFAAYAAALTSDPATTHEQSTGLFAHAHVITQIAKDLRGMQWYRYDREFREWAAAKGCRVWGVLNLPIYGRCMVPAAPNPPTPPTSGYVGKSGKGKKRPGSRNKACYKYNFEGSCGRSATECFYDHVCWHCGASDHSAPSCRKAPKRPAGN